MARTVNTGWRKVTPGACPDCGSDGDYGCDGRGTVLCSCNPAFDESFDTTEAGEPRPERVQLAPHLDWWMRGARYGEVVKRTRLYTHVRLDATGRVVKLAHGDVSPI